MMAGLAALAVHIAPALATTTLKLMGFAYIGQELAHIVTGEKTFQSTYQPPPQPSSRSSSSTPTSYSPCASTPS